MVKHFCDKCGTECEGIIINLNDEPQLFVEVVEGKRRRRIRMNSTYELCNDCYKAYVVGLADSLLPPELDKKEVCVIGPHGDEWINDSGKWDWI